MYIAIPSYKRADSIGKKTLKVLREEGFLASDITIFVANEEEAAEYERVVDKSLYFNIVVGVLTMKLQRAFILKYYPVGAGVLQIDDDIRGFKKTKECHLPTVFQEAFDYCKKETIPMWGIFPTDNGLYMKSAGDGWTQGLFLVIGVCFGSIINHIEPAVDIKEDWALSLAAYKEYGKLLRLDFIAPKTTCWEGKGGMNEYRTLDKEIEVSNKLLELFPEFIHKVYTKSNGHPDIKLKKTLRLHLDSLS
jgi:hypothetical protein